MDSHLVLGLPPTYIKQTDPSTMKGYIGGRAYRSLWGTVDSGRKKIVETKLYPVKITVGSPEKTKIGLMDTILNTIKDNESIDERIRIIKEDLEKKSQSGLNTFKFGSANRNGKNAYLETVNSLMEMLAYGEKVQDVDDKNNYFLSRDFTYLNNFREDYDYPTITILASEETTITETAMSEVGESLIKKVVDIGRESAREYNFLTGGKGINLSDITKFGDDIGGLTGSAIKLGAEAAEVIEKTATNILGEDIVQALLKGNQIMLPTVWKKSSFSKKYTIHFRLHTPYGSKKAIQRNILVPLMYILGFSLPIQKTASSISYPYLVKIDSEGAFNVPMGIVTNLSLKKGGRFDLWSTAGLFRAVDVTMEVADLYEVLPAPADRNIARIAHTTRNYISNMTGAQLFDDKDMSVAEKASFNSYYLKKPLIIPALKPAGIFSSIPIIGSKLDEYMQPVTSAIEGATSKVSGVINDGIGAVSSGVSSGFNSLSEGVSSSFSGTGGNSESGVSYEEAVPGQSGIGYNPNDPATVSARNQALSEEREFNATYKIDETGEYVKK